jgi:hypothetical protein
MDKGLDRGWKNIGAVEIVGTSVVVVVVSQRRPVALHKVLQRSHEIQSCVAHFLLDLDSVIERILDRRW